MEAKVRAKNIQAFSNYLSADGTPGVTASTGGLFFENGLFTGGTVSAVSTSIAPDSVSILGTGGNGYVAFSAQTVAPALGSAHIYADTAGRIVLGHSGPNSAGIVFNNVNLTATRTLVVQNKDGTIATTGDNVSQFTNDSGYVAGPASAVSGRLPSFSGTTGKIIQDSGILATDVVLKTRTISEGAGLAGNTYDLSANRTLALGTPSTNSVASTNSASGTTHTHAITTSSNPGAAASILATDASGFLRLVRLGIGTTPTQPLHVAGNAFIDASTANLYMKDTSTGLQVSTTGIINPQSGNSFRSTAYTSGVSGWNVSAAGDAEFNNVRVRGELAASVFKVSEISATAGTFGVFYSASTLFFDYTTPASTGSSATFEARNSDAGAMLFAVGDIVRLKAWTGVAISDSWLEILSRSNNGTTTSYFATLRSGSTSATFRSGTAIVDYGPSGTGFITLSTDGTVGSSPNMTMATHSGSPWSAFTTLLRLGNLNGSYGYATDVYGLGIGQYGTASKSWQTIDQTNGYRAGNNTTVLIQFDTSGNAAFGQVATNKSNAYWNASNSRLEFRGSTSGTVVQTYIDTDGSFVAGAGKTKLDASGLHLDSADQLTTGTGSENSVTWLNGTDVGGRLSHSHDNTSHYSETLLQSGQASAAVTSGFNASYVASTNNLGVSASIAIVTRNSAAGNDGRVNLYGSSNFSGVVMGSAATTIPTHMLDVYGTGWFQSGIAVPSSNNSAVFAADSAASSLLSLATNATGTPFGGTNSFLGGIFIVTGSSIAGDTAIFMVGGGVISIVAQTGTGFSLASGTAGKVNVYYGGGSVITIENKRAGTETLNVLALRTR